MNEWMNDLENGYFYFSLKSTRRKIIALEESWDDYEHTEHATKAINFKKLFHDKKFFLKPWF